MTIIPFTEARKAFGRPAPPLLAWLVDVRLAQEPPLLYGQADVQADTPVKWLT
jgi:hypothetical protein